MVHPSVKHLLEGRTYFGLHGLDKKLEKYLDFDNGYYVELGANDGYNQSNTLYFERSRGWRGVLIEPVAKNFKKCFLVRSEKNHIFHAACVSFSYVKPSVSLRYANLMTTPIGLESDIDSPVDHAESGAQYLRKGDGTVDINAGARTLESILEEIKAPRTIDLLSLDVEGAEIEVLKGVDHTRYRFDKLLVECRAFDTMNAYLESNGYQLLDELSHHDYLFQNIRTDK